MDTFETYFDPRNNHLTAVRHALAVAVLVEHSWHLAGFGNLLHGTGFKTTLGHLGVAGFFVLSGALITASWENSKGPREFVLKRLFRIMPAYWAALLFSALGLGPVAWVVEGNGQMQDYWSSQPSAHGYLINNALLMQIQTGIGNLFKSHVEVGAINGSLWSIPWEAACYGMVATIGWAKLPTTLKGRVHLCLLIAVALNFWLCPSGSILGLYYKAWWITILPVYFLFGAVFYLYRARIPSHPLLAAGFFVCFIGFGLVSWSVAAVFLPYLLFWASIRREKMQVSRGAANDYSYGLYIYSFPIQQTLIAAGFHHSGPVALLACTALFTLPIAILSWHFLEKPLMQFVLPKVIGQQLPRSTV